MREMVNQKIKLEDLNKDSTPCEICVAMNNREVETNETRNYRESERCFIYGSSCCVDRDKAIIKLLYLNSSL